VLRTSALAVVVSGLLVACSSGSPAAPPAGVSLSSHLPAALRAAVSRTLAVRSARSETTTDTATIWAVYEALDRALVVRKDAPAPGQSTPAFPSSLVQTYIGDRVYSQFGPEPVTVTTRPAKPSLSGQLVALNQVFLPILVLAHASRVAGGGDSYQFQTIVQSHAAGSSKATEVTETGLVQIRGGMIISIDETVPLPVPVGLQHRVTAFSDFNSAPAVVVPTVGSSATGGDVLLPHGGG